MGSPLEVGYVAPESAKYSPVRNLKVESLYPVVEGYKDSVGGGLRLNLSTPSA